MMRPFFACLAAVVLTCSAAYADSKPSDEEAAKIKATLTDWGCEGGTYEKETEATGLFEVDDAKCKGAQYDLKLDGEYKVLSLTRD